MRGLRQCIFNRPTAMDAMLDHAILDSNFALPRTDGHGASEVCQVVVPNGVVGLLSEGGPADISWFVTPIVVDSFQCHSGLIGWTYVAKEHRERARPVLAHRDAPASIAVESLVVGIDAPVARRRPAVIFVRETAAMNAANITNGLSLEAATASSRALRQGRPGDGLECSAGTPAIPATTTISRRGRFGEDGQTTKGLTIESQFAHGPNHNMNVVTGRTAFGLEN